MNKFIWKNETFKPHREGQGDNHVVIIAFNCTINPNVIDRSVYLGVSVDDAKSRFLQSGAVINDGVCGADLCSMYVDDELHLLTNPLQNMNDAINTLLKELRL